MSLNICQQISSSLELIDLQMQRQPAIAIESPSQVSLQNPHRQLLMSIRSDLIHYDTKEKHHRIVFSIQEYLSEYPDNDKDLIEVLQRILQIVESFRKSNQIIFSPEKPEQTFQQSVRNEALKEKSREIFRMFNEQS